VDAVTAYQSAYADLEKAVGIPLSFWPNNFLIVMSAEFRRVI
jgi:hypothetical protein